MLVQVHHVLLLLHAVLALLIATRKQRLLNKLQLSRLNKSLRIEKKSLENTYPHKRSFTLLNHRCLNHYLPVS